MILDKYNDPLLTEKTHDIWYEHFIETAIAHDKIRFGFYKTHSKLPHHKSVGAKRNYWWHTWRRFRLFKILIQMPKIRDPNYYKPKHQQTFKQHHPSGRAKDDARGIHNKSIDYYIKLRHSGPPLILIYYFTLHNLLIRSKIGKSMFKHNNSSLTFFRQKHRIIGSLNKYRARIIQEKSNNDLEFNKTMENGSNKYSIPAYISRSHITMINKEEELMEETEVTGWWDYCDFPPINEVEGLDSDWIRHGMRQAALLGGKTCRNTNNRGTLSIPEDEMHKQLIALGGRHVVKQDGDKWNLSLYVWPDGYFELNPNGAHYGAINDELFGKLQELGKFVIPKVEQPTQVKMIIATNQGYEATAVQVDPVPLIRDNYSIGVLHDYDHVVIDLKKSNPCGRITLLNGPPGTGKTYIIRSLLHGVDNGSVYILPSQLVTQLSGPSFTQLLLQQRGQMTGPMLFLIEDADLAITKRMADNMGTLSTLLNLADGIVGNLLDIRIIATTNAEEVEIDDALMRPGRLCRHIQVGLLSVDEARTVYERLCSENSKEPATRITKEMTLAEVYALLRHDTKLDEPYGGVRQLKSIGFSNG